MVDSDDNSRSATLAPSLAAHRSASAIRDNTRENGKSSAKNATAKGASSTSGATTSRGTRSASAPKRATVGRPRKASGAATTDRILDAAEDLFSKRGFDGVTVREVAVLANVDTALAHYYFQSKQGLFDAVLERRAELVFSERMRAFDDYEAQAGTQVTVEGAVAAFIVPLLERARFGDVGWKNYFRLIALVNNDASHVALSIMSYFDPLVHRLIALVKRALPDAREEELFWCFHFLTGSLTLALSRTGRLDRVSGGRCKSDDLASIEPRMIEYCAAGFRRVCAPPDASAAGSASSSTLPPSHRASTRKARR